MSDFESIVADRPTRRAERGGEFLGRNDCLLAVSGGFRFLVSGGVSINILRPTDPEARKDSAQTDPTHRPTKKRFV